MKSIITDTVSNIDEFKDYDIIFTFFPTDYKSRKVKYLFEVHSDLDSAIYFRDLLYNDLFSNEYADKNNLLMQSIKDTIDSVYIDDLSIEFNAVNSIFDNYNIDLMVLNTKNINQTIFCSICKARDISFKISNKFNSPIKKYSNFFYIVPSLFITCLQIIRTFFLQFTLQSKYQSSIKSSKSNISVIASGRPSDFRQIEKLEKISSNVHWYLLPNKNSNQLNSFIGSILRKKQSFSFFRIRTLSMLNMIFNAPILIRNLYKFLSRKSLQDSYFSNSSIFDLLNFNSKMFFFSSFISLFIISKYSFNDNKKQFSDKNIFLLTPGVGTNILNKYLLRNNLKTIHLQHGMMIQPFAYKFNVTENLLFSKQDVIMMDKICSKEVKNYSPFLSTNKINHSKFDFESNKFFNIGALSTTFYYSSNYFLKKNFDYLDSVHQSFYFTCLRDIKKTSNDITINFKFHPNQIEDKTLDFVDYYYNDLNDIFTKSDLIITPISSTILDLIYSQIPFLVYDPKIYLNDSYSKILNKDIIFNDITSLRERINFIQNNKNSFLNILQSNNSSLVKLLEKEI